MFVALITLLRIRIKIPYSESGLRSGVGSWYPKHIGFSKLSLFIGLGNKRSSPRPKETLMNRDQGIVI